MLKYITGRAYRPPTVETVLDYSGDEMPAAQRRKRSKERDQAQREKRRAEKDAEIRSVVSTRSSKSSHSSREGDAMREERRKEKRERRNKDRDCASSVSTSSASRVSRRVGSMVVKLPEVESLKTPAQPAAAAISTAHAITGRKRSPTMPTTLPTMRSLESEERDRSQTPRPVREQRSDPTLKTSTKPEKSSVEPAPVATTPALPSAAVEPAPVSRVRTASPGLGSQFPPPPHDIATPPHTPNSKTPMPAPEVAQQLPPTPVAEDELAKHNEALTGALVRRAHRPHIRTGSEVRFASPATDGARTPAPRSGWKPPQHRHHSEGYEQASFTPQPYYRQESNGRHKGELPPPPDYLYWQQRPQSAAGYYHPQGYYPQPYSPPTSHSQATPPSPPESAKSQPLPERERDPVARSSSAKPIRHSLPPPPPSQHDYYAYYQHRLITPPSQTPPLHHVPRYPPPPPTSADLEFLGPAPKRERKRRHSVHYPSSVYEPQQHMQYQHHNRVMTPVEGISPMSRPFHDFPPPGANSKRLAPSRLALSPPSSGSNESHRPPPRPEFTPNGSRNVFRFMDEAREEADDRMARNLDFDNETTVTSMIAVSAEYPTRERRPGVQRFVRRRAPEEVEYRAPMWGIRKEGAGEKMEREESVASGGSGISGVPLPAPAKAVVGIESEKFEVERPKLLPPVEFCEEAPVFEEEDEVVEQVVEEVEEVPEEGMLVVDEVEVADTLGKDIEEKLEQEEELGQSEEDEEDGDEAGEEVEDGQGEDEEEEDCDTVVGLDSGEIATEMFTEGVSVVGGRLESVEECHDEEEEEREEGSELEEEEEEEEEEDADEDDLHEPHMEEHQQATSSTHGGSDLGVSIGPDGEEDDQTAEGFLANLDNSSPPASSIFSTKSSATTVISLDSMFNPTNQSSASSVPTTISTVTDYSSGSSSASYIPQYMPTAFAYAPSPPPSTITSSTDYHGSTTNSSATTQYPMRNPHLMGMGVGIPHTPPRTQPGTRTTSPLRFKRTPLFPQQAGMLPMTPTESQVFPRFTSLNLRLLRHLEGELVGLERMLEEIEARMVNEDTQIPHENVSYHHVDGASPHGSVRSRVSSGSSDSSLPGEAGEMSAKRAEIMDALAWKLGQYNQALVNYQAMMDTFGPVLDPCSSPTRRPASRDSGVASSRGSSGVRHSGCATTSESGTSEYDGGEESEGYESLPGGWGVQEQEQEQEAGKAKASETHEPEEASMKQDIDIVLTGKRPTRSVSPSPSSCCPSHATDTHSTLSPSPKPLQSPETTLTQILVPPVLLLVVLCSLEWISSWGKILGLLMVFGVGKAWKGGVEEGEKRGQMARGRGRSGGARRVRERERYSVEE